MSPSPCVQSAYAKPQECALLQVGLTGQLLALQDLHEQLNRQGWRAVEAQAKAEQEATQLRVQSAAAQASHESAQQEVKRLEQQLAGSHTAAAPKQQLVTQVQSNNVCTCLSCTSLTLSVESDQLISTGRCVVDSEEQCIILPL